MTSQPLCSVSTLLCFIRAAPLWIIAVIALALIPLRAYLGRTLGRQKEKH
jgi:hypothetical protein